MRTITFFDTWEDLLELTGMLRWDDLWEAGFNLDDWDFGFVSDNEWIPYWEGQGGSHYYEEWLLDQMEGYCVGYNHTEYNGKHYYMAYHG